MAGSRGLGLGRRRTATRVTWCSSSCVFGITGVGSMGLPSGFYKTGMCPAMGPEWLATLGLVLVWFMVGSSIKMFG